MNSMKRQKDLTLKDELPRSVGTKYATAEEQRKNFIRNKQAEPKQKHHPVWMCLVVEVKSDAVKKQYRIGSWNGRSMNQGKLEVIKQEMTRVNINI